MKVVAKDLAEWAIIVKTLAGYRCERCGKYVKGKDANAHHLIPRWFMPQLSLDVNNGICLCSDCHKSIHGGMGGIVDREEQDPLIGEVKRRLNRRWNYEKENANA